MSSNLTNQKQGVSALGLQGVLGQGSYQTAWIMLHRLRRAIVRPGREQLKGLVEVDETYLAITDRQNPTHDRTCDVPGCGEKGLTVCRTGIALNAVYLSSIIWTGAKWVPLLNKQSQERQRTPVKASVYRLRDQGIKLPRPLPPRSGDVQLSKIDRSDLKYLQARLLDGFIDLLPPLHKAAVTRVTRNGMVIQGMEMVSRKPESTKARVSTHQQTWWVLVVCEEPNGMDVLEEIANGEDPLEYLPNASAMPPGWQRVGGS